jgi:hypothetical protein
MYFDIVICHRGEDQLFYRPSQGGGFLSTLSDLEKVRSRGREEHRFSKNAGEHFQFFTLSLWEDLKESLYHIFSSLIWDIVGL